MLGVLAGPWGPHLGRARTGERPAGLRPVVAATVASVRWRRFGLCAAGALRPPAGGPWAAGVPAGFGRAVPALPALEPSRAPRLRPAPEGRPNVYPLFAAFVAHLIAPLFGRRRREPGRRRPPWWSQLLL